MIVIKALSGSLKGGKPAEITINNVPVVIQRENAGPARNGLHIVLINEMSGKVLFSRVFDAYKTPVPRAATDKETGMGMWSDGLEGFITKKIPQGVIVVATSMDQSLSRLSLKAKQWFQTIGSKEIWNLKYDEGFAFITVMGRKGNPYYINERRSIGNSLQASVAQILRVKEVQK